VLPQVEYVNSHPFASPTVLLKLWEVILSIDQ